MKNNENNVLIVALTSYAGMGPYISEIVNEIELDDNVYFLLRDYGDNFFYKNIKKDLHAKCEFVQIPLTKWNAFFDILFNKNRLWKYIKQICKDKQIGLVHFIYNPVDVRTFKRLKKRGIKVVSTVHDLRPHEAEKEWYKMIRHRVGDKWLADSLKKGDCFITNSKQQERILKDEYPEKSIFYHSFPSLVTDIVKNGNDVPIEIKELNHPYILFFGLIEAYKGVSLLYDVFLSTPELNQNYCLLIAGRGTNFHIENRPEQNVLFINRYIADTEIAYLYRHARVVVYPYISATQSGVLSLASYFGTPILASDVPFFKESIRDGYNGKLFRCGDKKYLKLALLQLLNTDTTEISHNEKEYYKSYYEKGVLREQLLAIYYDIIG